MVVSTRNSGTPTGTSNGLVFDDETKKYKKENLMKPLLNNVSSDDVRGWLFRCEQLFLIDQVDDIDEVNLVSIQLYDKSLLCHTQFIKIHKGSVDWVVYKQAILNRFRNVYEDPLSELKNLKYETTARAYDDAFDTLLSRVEIIVLPEEELCEILEEEEDLFDVGIAELHAP
ncbi:hypothetical protein Tco_0702498 [Tanacetum coccineum]|uniref:Retrotransposon gag domain-containing protein n=1 Tax=Tanacetum coccineum TaxID=301880 RepID=A0ABQ4XXY4_9ASTR